MKSWSFLRQETVNSDVSASDSLAFTALFLSEKTRLLVLVQRPLCRLNWLTLMHPKLHNCLASNVAPADPVAYGPSFPQVRNDHLSRSLLWSFEMVKKSRHWEWFGNSPCALRQKESLKFCIIPEAKTVLWSYFRNASVKRDSRYRVLTTAVCLFNWMYKCTRGATKSHQNSTAALTSIMRWREKKIRPPITELKLAICKIRGPNWVKPHLKHIDISIMR